MRNNYDDSDKQKITKNEEKKGMGGHTTFGALSHEASSVLPMFLKTFSSKF